MAYGSTLGYLLRLPSLLLRLNLLQVQVYSTEWAYSQPVNGRLYETPLVRRSRGGPSALSIFQGPVLRQNVRRPLRIIRS